MQHLSQIPVYRNYHRPIILESSESTLLIIIYLNFLSLTNYAYLMCLNKAEDPHSYHQILSQLLDQKKKKKILKDQ